jgi:alkanesulfonate monooxygenase SsuD/methylene tetrahydromethanopterin reductase-like flavin-dependent oxidoreductase (luciferase family)
VSADSEAGGGRLSFGLKTSQSGLGYEEILAAWTEADRLQEFEDAWLWDHMLPLRGDVRTAELEAWTLLAALAAQTSRLRLGVIVTSNRLRPPALLAKMAATVDIVSGGRLVVGLGAGGSLLPDSVPEAARQLVVRELGAYGIPLVPAAIAITDLEETCRLLKLLWIETEPFDFPGRYASLEGAVSEPKPLQDPHPPLMIGAGGEQLALRVVAEHADVWAAPVRDLDEFRHKNAILDRHCAAVGRDPDEIVRSTQVFVRGDDAETLRTTRDQVVALIEAGAEHVVLGAVVPGRTPAWLAEEIVTPVRTRVGA